MGRKKKNKIGKYREEVLPNFIEAFNSLVQRYKKEFLDMTVLLNLNVLGKNFIFQRFITYPLISIKLASSKVGNNPNSILFTAKWDAGGALKYILPKSYFDIEIKKSGKKIEWEDVENFEASQARHKIETSKGFWRVDECELNGMSVKVDTKIEDIKSVNMYGWGFEIIGSMISMVAIKSDYSHDYNINNISMNTSTLSFDFIETIPNNELLVRWSEDGYEPIKEQIVDFDKILFGDSQIAKDTRQGSIKDVGQRSIKHIILD